jgi:hypothetical protein
MRFIAHVEPRLPFARAIVCSISLRRAPRRQKLSVSATKILAERSIDHFQ